MSSSKKKSAFFSIVLGADLLAVLGVVWLVFSPGPETTVGLPVTAALTHSAANHPVEFDAEIKNASNNHCLDLKEYKRDNGLPIQQWDCNNTPNQRIWVDAVGDGQKYRLRFEHSGKCLEPASEEEGAEVRQWVCHSGDYKRPNVAESAQHWRLDDLGDGYFSIVSVDSGLALTSMGTINGDSLQMMPWTGEDTQRFESIERNDHIVNPATVGSWGKLIAWPHVAVHASVTPNNRIVTWASNETDDFTNHPQETGGQSTWSSVYDLASEIFIDTNNASHDMFCAGTTLLEDGSLLASGGNPQAEEASRFDPVSNVWSPVAPMGQQRWYGTNVVTGSGDVFSTFAKGAQEIPELFSTKDGQWSERPGADMSELRDEQDLGNAQERGNWSAELQWYSFMHTSPDGRVFQSGPTQSMHWFSTEGQGSVQSAGTRMGESLSRQFGSAVMYDVGKLLVTGGSDPAMKGVFSSDGLGVKMGSTDTAMTIDINGAAPKVQEVAPMNARRSNHNAVVLPNGEVYVVGGSGYGVLFEDLYAAWWPEIWNPDTREWRTVAALSTPRTYHSWALLLQDGRVLSGGGGLCGDCSFNHPDAQIYTPPYLYDDQGNLASRPQIVQGTTETQAGGVVVFSTDREVSKFNMVRLSSVTHSINNDQRFIALDTEDGGSNSYTARINSNVNVMIPGMYWVFAVDAEGVPSEGHLIQVKSTERLQQSAWDGVIPADGLVVEVGAAMVLQLPTESFDEEGLIYSVIGMPSTLVLDESSGTISGSFHEVGEGSFIVSLSDGEVQTTKRVAYRAIAEGVGGDTGGDTNGENSGSLTGGLVTGGGSVSWLSLLLMAGMGFRRRF